MLRKFYSFYAILLFALPISAQVLSLDAPFTHITDETGLSDLTINTIVQDNDGYIWMGTNDGLNRYDGYDIKVYRSIANVATSLQDNFIISLYPAKDQGVWVGTNSGGLLKYQPENDGFIQYKHDPLKRNTISDNRVMCVYEDNSGIVWAGTAVGGLNRIDYKTGEIQVYKNNIESSSISSNFVVDILEDSAGKIWVRTDKNIECLNKETGKFTRLNIGSIDSEDLSYYSGSLTIDSEGFLWATAGNSILKINTVTFKTEIHDFPEYAENNLRFIDILPLNEDYMWVTHYEGSILYNFKNKTNTPFYHTDTRTNSIMAGANVDAFLDRTGTVWVSVAYHGVSKVNITSKAFHRLGFEMLNSAVIKGMAVDKTDNIWFCGDGMLRKAHFNVSSNRYEVSSTEEYERYFSDGYPNCIFIDSKESILIGTWGGGVKIFPEGDTSGIKILAPGNSDYLLADGRVQAIHEDRNHNYWIGTEAGVSVYNPYTEQYRHFKHNPDNANSLAKYGVQANCIVEDVHGDFWVGTWGGLTKVSAKNKDANTFETEYDFIQYLHDPDDASSLSDSRVISVFYDSKIDPNTVFAGTYGGGLNKVQFNAQNNDITNTIYRQDEGLANNTVYSMLFDDVNKLWISTNNGLSSLHIDSDEIESFDVNDGLLADQFFWGSRAKGNNGELYFGGIKGINMFRSDEIVKDQSLPSVIFTDLKIANKSVAIGKSDKKDYYLDKHLNHIEKLVLSHRENIFSIEFAALHYAFPEANKYKYMLEGFDKDWREVDSKLRFASYTNLDHGNYTFKVLASNYDGVWTKEPRELKIRIKPPFWKRWIFRIFIIIIIAIIAKELYRRRQEMVQHDRNVLEAKIKEGEALVAEKIKEVEEQKAEMRRREIEETEMRFTNRGIAQFSELLASDEDLKPLSQKIISELVQYMDGVMGVIYMAKNNEEQAYLEMLGSYAASEEVLNNKRIEVGEGYLGTCFAEGKPITLKDLPQDYTKITSGLGASVPRNVCLVPIKHRNQILGVIEIASLKEIEDYKVKFIEKIGENIASVITIKRSGEQMSYLLEQSQQQTEELKSQEEEMRQNIEEMHATQEELERQAELSEKLQKVLKKEKFLFDQLLEYSPVRVNFKDNNSKFIKASKSVLKKFGKSNYEEIIGLTEADFATKDYANKANADDRKLMKTRKSRINFVEHEELPDGSEIWKNVSKIPMFTDDNKCMGVLSIVYDLTESKLIEIENNYLNNALATCKELINASTYYLLLSSKGQILAASTMFCDHMGLQIDQVLNMHASSVFKIVDGDKNSITEMINKVVKEKSITLTDYFNTESQKQSMNQTFTVVELTKSKFEIIMTGNV